MFNQIVIVFDDFDDFDNEDSELIVVPESIVFEEPEVVVVETR